jgi:HTH-type transcriptional regulator/antitoxin HigA
MIGPLRSESDYEAAVDEIGGYFDRQPKPGTSEVDRFDLLAVPIEDIERKAWPIDPPDPVDAIRFTKEMSDRCLADLGRLLGSRQRASEILAVKRLMTMGMAWRLNREWGIPAEALIKPGRKARIRTAAE